MTCSTPCLTPAYAMSNAEDIPERRQHPARATLGRLFRHRLFVSGLVLFGIVAIMAASAPFITDVNPNRLSMRIARSRFTGCPRRQVPTVVRPIVITMAATVNQPGPRSSTVRQTPLIATLSPGSSPSQAASMRSSTPTSVAVTRVTVPICSTRPVNIRLSSLRKLSSRRRRVF